MSKLLDLYAQLEKASNAWVLAQMGQCDDPGAWLGVSAVLVNIAVYRDAHPGGETCATCRKWQKQACVEWGYCGSTAESNEAWISRTDGARFSTMPTFGCAEYEERTDAT